MELVLDECDINALYSMFEEFFNDEFESIEFYRKNYKSGGDWLNKMIFYDEQGFINRIEFYLPNGEISRVNYFEKSELQITSKDILEIFTVFWIRIVHSVSFKFTLSQTRIPIHLIGFQHYFSQHKEPRFACQVSIYKLIIRKISSVRIPW